MRRFVVARVAVASTLIAAGASFIGCGGDGGTGGGGGGSRACEAGTFEPSYTAQVALGRWRTLPVRVYFSGDFDYEGIDLRTVAREGFDEWVEATEGKVGYREVRTPRDADITVRLERLPRPVSQGVGITSATMSGGRVYGATITLRVWPGMDQWELGRRFRTTAAHEFGHALGIDGHSSDYRDLMFPEPLSDGRLTQEDVNTMRTAYCGLFGGTDRAGRAHQEVDDVPCVTAPDGVAVPRTYVCGARR